MKPVLAYWLYRSHALTKPRSLADGLIYIQALEHNLASDITGYLCRDEAVYVQYVEGPASALKALQDRILLDGRHRDVETLDCGVTRLRRFRRFAAWDMTFTDAETVSFKAFQRNRNQPGDLASASVQDLSAFMDAVAGNGLADLAIPPSRSYRNTQAVSPSETEPRRRILVVEDNWLVAMQAKHVLEDQGCEVIGPFGTVKDATSSALDAELDGAILDVNLGDETSLAVAEMLRRRNVPFAFATAYDASYLPDGVRSGAYLGKPYSVEMLGGFLAGIGIACR